VDYIIDQLLDVEYQQELFDYLRGMNSDNMDEFLAEFDDVYSEEELRLMRVKFISEMGN
jgi:ATP-dependent DNA helicase RecQ